MKKYLLFLVPLLFIGCSSGEEVNCNINGKDAKFILKNGIISKYELDGKSVSNRVVDEINGLNFTSSDNNTEGRETLEKYVNSLGGYCEK